MKRYKVKHTIYTKHYSFWMPWGFGNWLKRVLIFVFLLLCFISLFCLPINRLHKNDEQVILHTGDVQITLRWNTIDDVDLHVIDPRRDEIYYSQKTSRSGGILDVDANANANNTMRNPVENIYWPSGQAPMGKYIVDVVLYKKRTSAPISYKVIVKYGEKTEEYSGLISQESERKNVCTINYN